MSAEDLFPEGKFAGEDLVGFSADYRTLKYGDGLPVGTGTRVVIRELSVARAEAGCPTGSTIRAVIELEAHVTFQSGKCAVCGRETDTPDADALLYALHNHDGSRLLFPIADDDDREDRDRWPVPNWESTEKGLTCPECKTEMDEALKKVIAKRRKNDHVVAKET
jgi:hypothetical protein